MRKRCKTTKFSWNLREILHHHLLLVRVVCTKAKLIFWSPWNATTYYTNTNTRQYLNFDTNNATS